MNITAFFGAALPMQRILPQRSQDITLYHTPTASSADSFELKFGLRYLEKITVVPSYLTTDANGDIHPTSGLARLVVIRLDRKERSRQPGFAVLPNVADYIPAETNEELYEKIRKFQDELFQKVKEQFLRQSPELEPWKDYFHDISLFRPDGSVQAKGTGKDNQTHLATLKTFHHDAHAILLAHAYGPTVNTTGGELIIFDDKEFAKKNGIPKNKVIETLYERYEDEMFYCTAHLKEEWRDKIEAYTTRIPTIPGKRRDGLDSPPIIFINNLEVGHGANPALIDDPDQEASRAFYRSSFRYGIPGQRGGDRPGEIPPEFPFLPLHDPRLHPSGEAPMATEKMYLSSRGRKSANGT